MPNVLVDREALAALLFDAYQMRQEIAVEGGCASRWETEWRFLEPDDTLVTLAVQAGLPIPGPMAPGHMPPPPPVGPKAGVYYAFDDARPRCTEDGKVIYKTLSHAQHAAKAITRERQAMRAYLGGCGHFHLSRVK